MNENRTDLTDNFLALLRPLRRELEIYCRRMGWNEHDAPDAIQNAVLNAFKAFGGANIPLARAVVGGVMAAMIMVLFVVPILYLLLKGDKPAKPVG